MKKISILAVMLALFASCCLAQSRILPAQVDVRYISQISNATVGSCGCFTMEGGGVDANWKLAGFQQQHALIGVVADFAADHTGKVNNADYGLTLSTFTFGPRFTVATKRVNIFGQGLFGVAHGSRSQFPSGNSLVPSANSFAMALGAGADLPVSPRVSLRLPQIEYLHTRLPNTTSNWQNNLRLGVGITMNLSKKK